MSWRKITMKFPGTCIVCNEKIEANEIGLWGKGLGVKHEKCAKLDQINCGICGKPAGCPQCEFQDDCNLELVSQLCICKMCESKTTPYAKYQLSIEKKFPSLKII